MANLEKCEAIVLPDTVRYLGESAFAIDEALKYIDLGTGVETVDDNIFNTCTSLEKVEFPEGTKKSGLWYLLITILLKPLKSQQVSLKLIQYFSREQHQTQT